MTQYQLLKWIRPAIFHLNSLHTYVMDVSMAIELSATFVRVHL